MYLQRITIGIAAATLVASSTVAFAASSDVKKPLGKMTCGEFLTIEDRFQPKVIYYAVAHAKGGKVESAGVDIEGIENIVPAVTEGCKKAPKESFWEKVKAEVKKLEKKL
jgi:acid stress chaperone HdeA